MYSIMLWYYNIKMCLGYPIATMWRIAAKQHTAIRHTRHIWAV